MSLATLQTTRLIVTAVVRLSSVGLIAWGVYSIVEGTFHFTGSTRFRPRPNMMAVMAPGITQLFVGSMLAWASGLIVRWVAPARFNRCPRCDYPLSGDHCPECGLGAKDTPKAG